MVLDNPGGTDGSGGSDRPRAITGPERAGVVARLVVALTAAALLIAAMLVPVVVLTGMVASSTAGQFLNAHCDVRDTTPPQRSTLLASDGKTVIARLFSQNRASVRLADVPRPVVQALIATEDRRFYDHHGVDLRALLRAALHDLGGGHTQGGSTLTMQYVKQVRFYQARSDAERAAAVAPNLSRKLQNAKCAIAIEHRYSKRQILQKYFDIAFFGENSYGIATAAETYFGVPVSKLSVPQGALLVGLLQAPSLYDPFLHPSAARDRRNQVIANMVDVGYLGPRSGARLAREPLGLASHRPPPVPEGCSHANPRVRNAGYFCDYALNWLHDHGVSQHDLDTEGLRVVTTLDARLQSRGQQAIWRAGLKSGSDYILVMPSVDPTTGAVTSMITSRRYGIDGRLHRESTDSLFTAAYAGAGSTYKYFTAAAALAAGAPTSLELNTPGNEYRTKHCHSRYKVHNAGDYPDTMPLRDALPQSSNTYFVALEDEFFGCQLGPVVHTAVRLGLNRLREPLNDSAARSIADEVIGSQEPTFTLGQEPTSSLELTGAFGAAANDGVLCPAYPVLRVTAMDGHRLQLNHPACHRVLSRYVARTLITLMRKDTTEGTAAGYFGDWYGSGGASVAGKTGTDNNAADNGNAALWFVGMTPHLVSAASLVNPQHPKQTVHGLPGMPGSSVGQDVFGAFAATYWLDAYGPALNHSWTWPSAEALGGTPVPPVVGHSRDEASAILRAAGFHVQVFPVACGSDRPAGEVAYQEPPTAEPGANVTICLSSGIELAKPPPPVITWPGPKPKPPGGGGGGGGHGHGHGHG